MKATRNNVISNMLWRFLERCGAQGVTLIVSIVLARLLDPCVYGVIALVTVFTTIIQVFVDSGLGNALIQKKNADETDFSTVFWFNIVVCIVLYSVLFLFSPCIAKYYGMNNLEPVIKCMSIVVIISGVKNVQQAYVSRNMLFKKFFYATLGGTIGAAVIGIILAYKGYGIWALVIQNVFNQLVDTMILWIVVKWRPKFVFSSGRLRELLRYGSKLLISELIDKIYTQLRQLIIGKLYSTEDLAFYNKGNQFPSLLMTNINISIDNVLLPAMSANQDDYNKIKNMTKRSIQISTFLLMPVMTCLGVCADNLIRLILTEKWIFVVPYMRVFCIIYAFYPIHTANLSAIKSIGRSDIYMKLEIVKKISGLIILVLTMKYGAFYIAVGLVLENFVAQIINSIPTGHVLKYNYKEQILDILPNIILSIIMGIVIMLIPAFIKGLTIVILFLQLFVGVIVYGLFAYIFKNTNLQYIINIIKEKKSKNV